MRVYKSNHDIIYPLTPALSREERELLRQPPGKGEAVIQNGGAIYPNEHKSLPIRTFRSQQAFDYAIANWS